MIININQIELPKILELKEKISDSDFLNQSIDYLDDGYELTELESFVYQKNNIFVNKTFLNHISCAHEWFKINSDKVYCDHSAILCRYSFENYFPQIIKLKNQKKELLRFFDIKSKYGLDFYFQFLGENNCFDIIHIENDYFDYSEFLENKEIIEKTILSTNWEEIAISILKKKSEWEKLPKDDQHDWKAKYFGFPRAFFTKK